MSYRTFKRVLGETSLERKCLWWFGVSLAVLLWLSFYWYSNRTAMLVYDRDRVMGRELVRAAWLEEHAWFEQQLERSRSQIEGGSAGATAEQDHKFFTDLIESNRDIAGDFKAYAILPSNAKNVNPPQSPFEQELLATFSKPKDDPSVADDPVVQRGFDDRIQVAEDGQRLYHYWQPIYAKASCISCHSIAFGKAPQGDRLTEGALMAVMRITTDQQATHNEIAKNKAYLWSVAVAIGFVSMFLLYFIIRYVIVKPVTHLRDVSDAVREGDVTQRAEIRTGDEFEELGAAFNRMLRQLLSQQDELQDVNKELDGKLDQLAQANMRLYELNRLKSDFLATMSHELRTPLNSILGFSDVLSTIDRLDDKQKRYVGNIQRSGRMLLEMINDILDLAKMESGRMDIRRTEFPIDSVVAAQCDMARPLTERKNIDLDCQVTPRLPKLRQDQAKLQQILNNLLSNAIKFTPEGGRITVSADRDAKGRLQLQVADTGIGISESEQQMVFEKFRQGTAVAPTGDTMTREHSGTGLGLSIVRELCRLLGGEVSLRSTLGKGSTFTVELPWEIEPDSDLDAQMNEEVLTFSQARLTDLFGHNGSPLPEPAQLP